MDPIARVGPFDDAGPRFVMRRWHQSDLEFPLPNGAVDRLMEHRLELFHQDHDG